MDKLAKATQFGLYHGFTTLQIFMFADTDDEHVNKLLELLDPHLNSRILDVGSGVGSVARRMFKLRPDLEFTLINNNAYQLALTQDFHCLLADMHQIPLAGPYDIVMCNYTLGFGSLHIALVEFHRLLKPGGILFIVDMLGPSLSLLLNYEYRTFDVPTWQQAFAETGFEAHQLELPPASLLRFRQYVSLLTREEQRITQRLLADLKPVIWRCHRDPKS